MKTVGNRPSQHGANQSSIIGGCCVEIKRMSPREGYLTSGSIVSKWGQVPSGFKKTLGSGMPLPETRMQAWLQPNKLRQVKSSKSWQPILWISATLGAAWALEPFLVGRLPDFFFLKVTACRSGRSGLSRFASRSFMKVITLVPAVTPALFPKFTNSFAFPLWLG